MSGTDWLIWLLAGEEKKKEISKDVKIIIVLFKGANTIEVSCC